MLPDPHNPGRHYALVARALSFIRDNARAQPSLEDNISLDTRTDADKAVETVLRQAAFF